VDKIDKHEVWYILMEYGVKGAMAARSIEKDANDIGRVIQKRYGFRGAEDNPADAVRHAYLSSALTRRFGVETAYLVTTLHEEPSSADRGRVMDFHNKGMAIRATLENPELSLGAIAE
jgi:hypothetical protein